MRSDTTTRIGHLRAIATAPVLMHTVHVSPLIDHFVRSRAKLLGISQSEFWRRVMLNDLTTWQKHGLYQIPEELLSLSEAPVRGALPSAYVAQRYLDPSNPLANKPLDRLHS